MTLTIQIGKYQ